MVLSVFPGIDLFGRAFEVEGCCVVRGPDLLWGGDVRRFHPDPGWAWGIIGGPPCQDFSRARRSPATGHGVAMLLEFCRVVSEAMPEWFLMENVPGVGDVDVPGYSIQRTQVDQGWFSSVSRSRHFQFGSRSGVVVDVPVGTKARGLQRAALANDSRGFRTVCDLQGLGGEFELAGFTREAAIAAVGNGVPLVLGRLWARAIRAAYGLGCEATAGEPVMVEVPVGRCACGCGRRLWGNQVYRSAACRKRAQRKRDAGQS